MWPCDVRRPDLSWLPSNLQRTVSTINIPLVPACPYSTIVDPLTDTLFEYACFEGVNGWPTVLSGFSDTTKTSNQDTLSPSDALCSVGIWYGIPQVFLVVRVHLL